MKTNEIIEGNIALAEFMGYKLGHPDPSETRWADAWFDEHGNRVGDLPYFSGDWNLLIPVVEKIESFEDENRCAKFNVNIEQGFCEITDMSNSNQITHGYEDTKIESVFQACVSFAKWHKNQPK